MSAACDGIPLVPAPLFGASGLFLIYKNNLPTWAFCVWSSGGFVYTVPMTNTRKTPAPVSPRVQAILDAADAAIANDNDPNTPWTPAWVAAQMTTTVSFRRVADTEGCCPGGRCYHYAASVTRKVRGKDADLPTGAVTSLHDGIVGRRRFTV